MKIRIAVRTAMWTVLPVLCVLSTTAATRAGTNTFFYAPQVATVVATNMTDTTVRSSGYLFTYSVDGWWSAMPGGPPTGRMQPIQWPAGVDAQAITTGPTAGTGASVTIKRADGQPFDMISFAGKILGNTAAAGASFELMPQLNGVDAFSNPLTYDATGYAGNTFGYTTSLSGYDTYVLSLWMDFGLIELTVADGGVITRPALKISGSGPNTALLTWPATATGFTLLQSSNFNARNWTVVTNSVSVVGTNNQVTVPLGDSTRFYQLIY